MDFIPVKKAKIEKNGKETDVFVIPAMVINKGSEKEKKIPHANGNSTLAFETKEEALDAIKRCGLLSFEEFKANVKTKRKPVSVEIDESLIELLDDSYSSVVASSAFALGEIRSEKAIKPLIECLSNKDNTVSKNAIEALAKIGKNSIYPLLKALENKEWEKRNAAAKCLGEMAQYKVIELEKAVAPLIYLLSDDNPVIKSTVALSLAKIYKLLEMKQK